MGFGAEDLGGLTLNAETGRGTESRACSGSGCGTAGGLCGGIGGGAGGGTGKDGDFAVAGGATVGALGIFCAVKGAAGEAGVFAAAGSSAEGASGAAGNSGFC